MSCGPNEVDLRLKSGHCDMSVLFCRVLVYAHVVLGVSFPALGASVDWAGCAVPKFGDDRSRAIEACTIVLNRADLSDVDRARALITRGRAEHMRKDIDAAIRDFDDAINLVPRDPEPLARRASAAFFKRDYPTAFVLTKQALQINPDYAVALDILGVIGLTSGDYQMAKTAFDRAIALKPDDVDARFNRFQYWMAINAQREGLRELADLLALSTSDLDTQFTEFRGKDITYRTFARLERATMLEAMGRYPEAIKAFDDFVQTDPGVFSYGWRGWYHIDRSQLDLAKADVEKALSYDPNFFLLHELQGLIFTGTNEYERAVASFTRALELGPDQTGDSYWWRALAQRALHHPEAAQNDALKAFSTDPTFLRTKLKVFKEFGYWQPPSPGADASSAVRDAAQACMLDERCW